VVTLQALALAPNPIAVGVGQSVRVTITIGDIAPEEEGEEGLLVTLSGVDPKIASAPASVTISDDTNTVTFSVTGVAVGNTSITATAPGHVQDSVPINVGQNQDVLPPSALFPRGGSVQPPSALVAPGGSGQFPATLSGPAPPGSLIQFPFTLSDSAPPGGVTVTLWTVHPDPGTVDTPLTMPGGATRALATVGGICLCTEKTHSAVATYTLTLSAPGPRLADRERYLESTRVCANFDHGHRHLMAS
jgi:hypothetical protein